MGITNITDRERELIAENERLKATLAKAEALSVTKIMLDVVPGEDGNGEEVYAESVEDVENKLSDLGSRLENWELGIKRHPFFENKITELEAKISAPPVPTGLIEVLKEASEILNDLTPETAPPSHRWPIVDELDGFALMLAASIEGTTS